MATVAFGGHTESACNSTGTLAGSHSTVADSVFFPLRIDRVAPPLVLGELVERHQCYESAVRSLCRARRTLSLVSPMARTIASTRAAATRLGVGRHSVQLKASTVS